MVGLLAIGTSSCVSYQYERRRVGTEIPDVKDAYRPGRTTLFEVLSGLGAPDDVYSLDNRDLLVYRRSLYQESGLSLGIPMLELTTAGNVDISASGALTRYDILTFFFSPQGVLEEVVFEKGSDRPYLKTLFPEK